MPELPDLVVYAEALARRAAHEGGNPAGGAPVDEA